MSKPLTVLCVNGESDPAETGSFIEMHKAGVDITVITWPGTFNYDALLEAGVPIWKHPETTEVTGAGGKRWKATFLFAFDPDGHLLEINQPHFAEDDGSYAIEVGSLCHVG